MLTFVTSTDLSPETPLGCVLATRPPDMHLPQSPPTQDTAPLFAGSLNPQSPSSSRLSLPVLVPRPPTSQVRLRLI